MNKKISVIIPSFNSADTLEFTLSALDRQSRRDLIEEIIVVDSSDDPRIPALRERCKARGVLWIAAGVRVMPAVARNLGARRARGGILVFIDSDAYMSPDWVEKIAEGCDKGWKAGGGAVVMPQFQKRKLIAWAQYFLQFNEYVDSGPARIKEFLPSCNMFCDREIFFACGGFPEIRAAEDVLFFLKAGRLAKVWFIPQAKAFHIFRENFGAFARNQRLLGEHIIKYRRIQWIEKFYYKGFWPVFFLPSFALIKFWRMTRRILASRPSLVLGYAASFPIVLIGLFFWSLGFYHGSLR